MPPLHFHPYQTEYIRVLLGSLNVEVEGRIHILSSEAGEFSLRPFINHRLYPGVNAEPVTKFILSGTESEEKYKLDAVFFQNWYGYQDQIVSQGGKGVDLIQVLSMFDAGGSYLSLPWYIPGGQWISRVILGVFLGRWLGGLLGYQPFYKEWTNDWDIACNKMQDSVFQRRFAVP